MLEAQVRRLAFSFVVTFAGLLGIHQLLSG